MKTAPGDAYNLALAGLIMSLLFFVPFLSLVGLIFGIIAWFKISKSKDKNGKGLALAAVIVGLFILILQVLLVLFVFSFINQFAGIAGILEKGSPESSIQSCLEKKGLAKEMCIVLTISANLDQNMDPKICDEEINTLDLNSLCNAVLKKDKTYCAKIEDGESRIKCFGLVEEIKQREVIV